MPESQSYDFVETKWGFLLQNFVLTESAKKVTTYIGPVEFFSFYSCILYLKQLCLL